ncbi:MAG: TldD/PmbA family protein, partial [Terriglobia bacterium]
MHSERKFFEEKFNVTETDLERYLGEALSAGGEYADLYFEYRVSSSISLDESLIKGATQGVSAGVGVRVIAGERSGYAYSDDLSAEKILKAARIAAQIAQGPARVSTVGLSELQLARNLYPVIVAPTDVDLAAKLDLVVRADKAARAYDSRITQVRAGYADEVRHVLTVTSDGGIAGDFQPLARLSVFCLAQEGKVIQRGSSGGGGRVELRFFLEEKTPEHFAREAARQAVVQLSAVEAPAGEMEVVLGPGWPGILLHEAVGHGLESDFNRKKTSAFSGLLGQKVASELCTVVDDGTIPGRRGSLNVDDEGTPTSRT